MKIEDQDRFDVALLAVAEMYGRELTTVALGLAWQALLHLPFDVFERALQRHVQDPARGHRFPLPADIIHQTKRGTEAEAHEALTKLDQLVETYGRDGLGVWQRGGAKPRETLDPAGEYALRCIGGWKTYCDRTEQESPFMRKDFIAAYKRGTEHETEHGQLTGEGSKMIEELGVRVGELT